MTYNTNITGIGFVPLMQTANAIVDGYLGLGLLILYLAVAFVVMKNYPSKKAFLSASFLGAIISILFNQIKIVTDVVNFGFLVLFFGGMIWIFLQE